MKDRIVQYSEKNASIASQIHSNTAELSQREISLIDVSINKEWSTPKYKLKYFVGQQQITPFAKLRQWLLEIKSREETIETLEYEIAKWDIEIARAEQQIEMATNEFDRELARLEHKKYTINHVKSKRRLNSWYLERQQLLDLITEFLDSDEGKLPDGTGRTYMDILNTDEEEVYEQEYWTNRLGKQAACDLLFYGRVNTGNMDAILSMDPVQQTETLGLALNYATRLQGIQNNLQLEINQQLGLPVDYAAAMPLPKLNEESFGKIGAKAAEPVKSKLDGDDLDVYSS